MIDGGVSDPHLPKFLHQLIEKDKLLLRAWVSGGAFVGLCVKGDVSEEARRGARSEHDERLPHSLTPPYRGLLLQWPLQRRAQCAQSPASRLPSPHVLSLL